MEFQEKHTISVLVENKFGVLARVAGLFSGRGYNISSLTVHETEDPRFSKMTIVTTGDAAILEQIDKQKLEQRRVQNLIRSNAANTKQLDDINSQLAVLEKQLAAQRSTLENNNRGVSEESSGLEIQIAQVEDQLGKCRIKSPISGTVLTKYAERGEVTAQGKPLFKIADTDSMKLRAYISSGQLTELKLGDPVRVLADAGDKGSRQ